MARPSSDTSFEEFCLVDKDEAAGSPQGDWWAAEKRRSRLPGLLRPWAGRRGKPPAPTNSALAPAPPSRQLSAIPILSLGPTAGSSSQQSPPVTFINPLTVQPLAGQGPEDSSSAGQPLQLFALPPAKGTPSPEPDALAACSAWLQQLPNPLQQPAYAGSDAGSLLSGMSACSRTSSSCGDDAGAAAAAAAVPADRSSGGGSFCCPPHPDAAPGFSGSSTGGGDSSGGSSRSNLLNLLMQQAEPTVQEPPSPSSATLPAPALSSTTEAAPEASQVVAAAAVAAPAAAAAPATFPAQAATAAPQPAFVAVAGGSACVEQAATPNPLLQLSLPLPLANQPAAEPQAALLSWRRHAQHAWQHSDRREPELLRRLLSHTGSDEAEAGGRAAPLSPSGAAGAGTPPYGSASGRGRASARHLLVLTAVLAVMVMLLHAMHSRALHEQMADEQQQGGPRPLQRGAAAAASKAAAARARSRAQVAALQAAMLEAAAADGAGGFEGAAEIGGQDAFLAAAHRPARGHSHAFHHAGSEAGPKSHKSGHHAHEWLHLGGRRLPRFHLRRRLTLLLFTQQRRATGSGADADGGRSRTTAPGTTDTHATTTTTTAEEFVFEEWEVSLGGE